MTKLENLIINFIIIAFLTFVAFAWSFWVFHKEFLLLPVLSVMALRILSSLLIFNDYSASWSKASAKSFLIKTSINLVAFIVYVPIFYGEVRIALFVSELFIYLFLINFSVYFYQYLKTFVRQKDTKCLAVFGAGQAGVKIAKEFSQQQFNLQVFIDDDKALQNRSIDGVKILSKIQTRKKYPNKAIDLLVIAIPSASSTQIKDVYQFCSELANEVKILPSLSQILLDKPYTKQLKNIDINDLLARHPADLDTRLIKDFIVQKTVLITGAGGTIGSELAKQCLTLGAKQLILIDHSEFNLYQIEQTLDNNKVVPVLLSITNKPALIQIFKQYSVQIIIHAAAYKHVPMVEANIEQAIINNILGSQNIIDIAIAKGVEKVVLISTDKAVRPTNVMGATKRVCELYAQNVKAEKTQIVCVRFGNVLGSSGSVIPLFEQQIQNGGPITITDPEITRYFMLAEEACQLVLQASVLGQGGEVFILDMGEPVKILDLAQQMIELSRAKDIQIIFTGLRSGEKLYEELLINDSDKKTSYTSITVAKKDKYDIKQLNKDIKHLFLEVDKIKILQRIVPEFNHKP